MRNIFIENVKKILVCFTKLLTIHRNDSISLSNICSILSIDKIWTSFHKQNDGNKFQKQMLIETDESTNSLSKSSHAHIRRMT